MSERLITCKKLNKELPGLAKPPFNGALGKEIFENISAQAWAMWRDDMQMKVLNEYRLNMGDPKDYAVLMRELRRFLNLELGETLEVENAQRGKGV